MSEPIRVVVADDQALVREGIATILELVDGISVVGQAADGREAVALALAELADVVMMDLRMPVMTGAEAIAELARVAPQVRVVVLTTFADDASIQVALDAGAAGYLTKDANRTEMVLAVRAAASGGMPLDARIVKQVVSGLTHAAPQSAKGRFPALTCREAEVLDLMVAGLANPAIAAELYLEVSTVKTHVNAIFAKLGVRSRAEAIAAARSVA